MSIELRSSTAGRLRLEPVKCSPAAKAPHRGAALYSILFQLDEGGLHPTVPGLRRGYAQPLVSPWEDPPIRCASAISKVCWRLTPRCFLGMLTRS